MGKTRTPKYRIEMRMSEGWSMVCEYNKKPNYSSLKAYIDEFHESMNKGNCNEHLREKTILMVNNAKVIEQKTDKVLCEYIAPLFYVI